MSGFRTNNKERYYEHVMKVFTSEQRESGARAPNGVHQRFLSYLQDPSETFNFWRFRYTLSVLVRNNSSVRLQDVTWGRKLFFTRVKSLGSRGF